MKKQKSAILQIFYGQRGDSEKVKCAPTYFEYLDKAIEYNDKLCELLKDMPKALELLSQYKEWAEKALIEEVDEYYAEGFKFGLLIGVEAGESKFQ